MHKSDLTILRDKRFARTFLSRTLTVLGGSISPIAIAFAVLDLPGANAKSLALVEMMVVTFQVIAIMIGGVLADRWSRSGTVSLGGFVAAIGMGFIGILFSTEQATIHLIAYSGILIGLGSGLGFPVYTAIIADIVAPEQRQSANALIRLGRNISGIGGAGIAGTLVYAIGNAGTQFIVTSLFLASALNMSGLQLRANNPSGKSIFKDLKDGWQEFVSRPWIVVVVVASLLINACAGGAIDVVGPVIAKAELGGARGWSLIVASGSIGTVLGALIAMRIRYRRPLVIGNIAMIALPISFYSLSAPMPLIVCAATFVLSGIAGDIFGVAWDGALQREVPPDALARVSAYDWFGSMAAAPIGIAVAGASATRFGNSVTMQWLAILALVGVLAPLCFRSVTMLASLER
jgi:MFS family permease